jgi:uncharacterized protein (TIGR02145 family)
MHSKYFLFFLIVLISCNPSDDLQKLLEVETQEAVEITHNSAIIFGNIIGPLDQQINSIGICWALNKPRPTILDNVILSLNIENSFSILLENLDPKRIYYARAFVENTAGISYGNTVAFTTEYEIVKDIDGNVYRAIKIGLQTWTIDNFNSTRFYDGSDIPIREDNSFWMENSPKEPAMCWHNNDRASYESSFGALYNAYAATHPLIAPEGWRVPTISDYRKLLIYIAGIIDDFHQVGGILKQTGFDYWLPPNSYATNASGFSAKAGGTRWDNDFQNFGIRGVFVCSSEFYGYSNALFLSNTNNTADLMHLWPKYGGYSLRLIKEE